MMFKNIDFSKSYTQNWAKQSGNLLVADIAGTAAEAVAIANASKVERMFPNVTNAAVNALSGPISYFQKPIEQALSYGKNFEGEEYYKQRMSRTPEQRSKDYARAGLRYGVAVGIGAAATYATEHHALSKLTNAKPIPLSFYTLDWVVHGGFIALMAVPALAPAVEKTKQVIKAVTKTLGADEETSEDIARITTFSGIPNYATFAVLSTSLYHHNKKNAEAIGKLGKELGILSEVASHIR